MFEEGMTGFRLNMSHISLPDAADTLEKMHIAARKAGVIPELLIDMQGPEIRVRLKEALYLREKDQIHISAEGVSELVIPMLAMSNLRPGQNLLLDDGKILCRVDQKDEQKATCTVLRGGLLKDRKSMSISGVDVPMPAMTELDRFNISRAKEFGVTGIMQPFVRSPEDLLDVKQALQECGNPGIRIFAKIENICGVQQLEKLIPEADEIVIARGDLGNSMNLWDLPGIQKKIASICQRRQRDFMVVTQMLASMEENPVPTRAEISDIFNAVLDGARSVMVTGETATGKYPVETIRYLVRTAEAAERYRRQRT